MRWAIRKRRVSRFNVNGAERVRDYLTALMTVRRLLVPEISRGRLAVTSSLLKTLGAPPWVIMPFSIVTGATVVFGHAHERDTNMTAESQTSSIFTSAANSRPGRLPPARNGHF